MKRLRSIISGCLLFINISIFGQKENRPDFVDSNYISVDTVKRDIKGTDAANFIITFQLISDSNYSLKMFYNDSTCTRLLSRGYLYKRKMHGVWDDYSFGALHTTNYRNGKREGPAIDYYENGKIHIKAFYKQDVAEGVWKIYTPKGKLIKKIVYKNGRVIMVKDYSPKVIAETE